MKTPIILLSACCSLALSSCLNSDVNSHAEKAAAVPEPTPVREIEWRTIQVNSQPQGAAIEVWRDWGYQSSGYAPVSVNVLVYKDDGTFADDLIRAIPTAPGEYQQYINLFWILEQQRHLLHVQQRSLSLGKSSTRFPPDSTAMKRLKTASYLILLAFTASAARADLGDTLGPELPQMRRAIGYQTSPDTGLHPRPIPDLADLQRQKHLHHRRAWVGFQMGAMEGAVH